MLVEGGLIPFIDMAYQGFGDGLDEDAWPVRDLDYLVTQRGMFSYTGLSGEQVDELMERHAIYLIRSGCMCMTGLAPRNIEQEAQASAAVMR